LATAYLAWLVRRVSNVSYLAASRHRISDMADDSRDDLLAEADRLRERLRAVEARQGAEDAAFAPGGDHFRWLMQTLRVVPWEGPVARDDQPFCFRYVGPQAAALLGYSPEQWHRPGFWEDRLHPDDREAAITFCREQTLLGRDHTFEYRLVASDGRPVWVLDVVRVIQADGRPVSACGFLLDVSERKKPEQSLWQAQEWLALALEAAEMICYRTDLSTGEVTFSGDTARFHGTPPDVSVRTAEQMLQLVHPDDRAAFQAGWAEAMAGRQMRVEFRGAWPAADGGPAWFDSRARLFRHKEAGAGVLRGVTGDVTVRKREEEQRRRLEVQMHQTQQLESLEVLAGGIAHEFNNLLTTIQGYADLARADLPAGPAHGYLGEVLAASRRAAELTQQILAYAGKGRFFFQPVSLDELATQMSPLLAAAVSRKARLLIDTQGPVPPIEGDVSQLRQILLSLVTNASESLQQNEGTITFRLGETQAEQPPGRFALIEVTDTGSGMDEATKARIFEPFFSTKFTGRGLGLAAVLGIVRRHAGALCVNSAPGRSTTFRVYLPPAAEAEEGTPAVAAAAAPAAWLGGGLVLVVDDEESVRHAAAALCRALGFDVIEAADGCEALRKVEKHPGVALVLLDWTMPRCDGASTAAELRRARPDLPVVIMSGYSETELQERLEVLGAAGFLKKPFNLEQMRQRLREALEA
jgi:two-component system, cell cycle sensor histidine kinase and response regulator CckA